MNEGPTGGRSWPVSGGVQAVQENCPALRKNSDQFRLNTRSRLRIHLDKIRPHGLAFASFFFCSVLGRAWGLIAILILEVLPVSLTVPRTPPELV